MRRKTLQIKALLIVFFGLLSGLGLQARAAALYCPDCGQEFVAEDIGDTFAATCTGEGYAYCECSNCGFLGNVTTEPPTGHDYIKVSEITEYGGDTYYSRASTCYETGIQYYECSACGDHYGKDLPMTAHKYKAEILKKPTCVKEGKKEYVCSECGDEYLENIPATGKHDYKSKVTKAATCAKTGVKTFTCSVCGKSYTEKIAATGKHDYKSQVTKAATCTAEGIKTFTCSVCGDSYTEKIPATGQHSYTASVIKAAGCGADGTKQYTCSFCGKSYTENIPATGQHSYVSEITKEALCAEDGTVTYRCSVCGKSYTEDIPATGEHSYPEEWIVEKEATEEEEGLQYKLCEVCGEARIEEVIPVLVPETTEETFEETTEAPTAEGISSEEASSDEAPVPIGTEEVGTVPETSEEAAESTEAGTETEPVGPAGPPKGKGPGWGLWLGIGAAVLAAAAFALSKAGIIGRAAAGATGTGAAAAAAGNAAAEASVSVAAPLLAGAAGAALGLPELKDKTVLTYLNAGDYPDRFIRLLKGKTYLSVKTAVPGEDSLAVAAKDEQPDLIILEAEGPADLEEKAQLIRGLRRDYKDGRVVMLAAESSLPELKPGLEALMTEKLITRYEPDSLSLDTLLNRFILPIYKPELNVENSVEFIGKVADVLGISGISFLVNLYVNGRDIKENAQKSEVGIDEKSVILADIASILGLDKLASVLGLIDDVDAAREALDKESGAHDRLEGGSAVKDAAEVISSLLK